MSYREREIPKRRTGFFFFFLRKKTKKAVGSSRLWSGQALQSNFLGEHLRIFSVINSPDEFLGTFMFANVASFEGICYFYVFASPNTQ